MRVSLYVLASACAKFGLATGAEPTATTRNGTYVGVHSNGYDQDFFLGIPFSKPPMQDLRLALPQPLDEAWTGTRNATAYGPGCVGFLASEIDRPISEDCLSINVIRPAGHETVNLPVMVWIYGGGFAQGLNADPRYNLSFIVRNSVDMGKPIVAASINYRLNGYGFLSSSELSEAGAQNLGLHDQRLALQWVQENIVGFGGDPSKVTVFGQSAGAMSIGMQLIAYGGVDDGLFRGAICNSGGPVAPGPQNATVRQKQFDSIVEATNCSAAMDKLDCLRKVPADAYADAVNATGGSYAPVVDDDMIPGYPSELVKQGKFVKVPLLIGANHDEGTNLVGNPPTTPFPDDAAFAKFVAGSVRNASMTADAIKMLSALYPNLPAIGIPETLIGTPNGTFGAQYKRVAALGGDIIIHRGRRSTAQAWSQAQVPVYSYEFDAWPIAGQPDNSGTTHFTEIQLVFDNEAGNGYVKPWWPRGSEFAGEGQVLLPLARLMSRMWVSFVHDQDPNNHGINDSAIPVWPLYAGSANASISASSIDDARDGYGVNFRFHQDLDGLAEVQADVYRAEAINWLIEKSAEMLLF